MDRSLAFLPHDTVMPPMEELAGARTRTSVLALAAALVAILVIHLESAASLVEIGRRSDAFAHGWVVVPISLWLVWRRRRAQAQQAEPRLDRFAAEMAAAVDRMLAAAGGARQ